MNLYRKTINAIGNFVYKQILKRGKKDLADIKKISSYLAKRKVFINLNDGTNEDVSTQILEFISKKPQKR